MQYKLPPLKALQTFTYAAKHLSFTKASQELCVTSAAVGYQIRSLEQFLGTNLFLRLPGGIKLTREGETLQSACGNAFNEIGVVVEAIGCPSRYRGVSVASVPHFSARILFPARQKFMARYPQYNLRIDHTFEIPDFSENSYDFAVLFGDGDWPEMNVELLFLSSTTPVCAPEAREEYGLKDNSDISKAPILLDSSCFHSMWIDWFKKSGLTGWEQLTVVQCSDLHAILEAAVLCQGVVMEPDFVVHDHIQSGKLIRPFETTLDNYGYFLVYPKSEELNAAGQAFKSWLKAAILAYQEDNDIAV